MKALATRLLLLLLLGAGIFVGDQLATKLRPAPCLEIASTPSGASVFIDGVFRGVTPLALTDLTEGEYQILLTQEGMAEVRRGVSVSGETRLDLPLTPARTATLQVSSTPLGAMVLIDGEQRGRTPLLIEGLPVGVVHLELTLTNYLPVSADLRLSPQQRTVFRSPLKHRQVEACRERIERHPEDIGAYNDLGELLLLRDDPEGAAEVFVKGLIAIGKNRLTSFTNRYNAEKLQKAMHTTMHKHRGHNRKFKTALDREVLAAIEAGEFSTALYEQFRQVQYDGDIESYLRIYEGLARTHVGNHGLLLDYIDFCRRIGKREKAVAALTGFIAREGLDAGLLVRCLRTAVQSYRGARERENLAAFAHRLAAHPGVGRGSAETQVEVWWELSRLATSLKDEASQLAWLEKGAGVKEVSGRKYSLLCTTLARRYLTVNELENALAAAEKGAQGGAENDGAVRAAVKLRDEIKRRIAAEAKDKDDATTPE